VRSLVIYFLIVSAGYAQDSWVGRKCMPRAGTRFSKGTYVVPEVQIARPFTVVREVSADVLDIGSAYVVKSKVVPLEDAAAYYTEYLRADPKSIWALTNRAIVWREGKQWDQALAELSEAIRLDPKHPWLRRDRGSIYLAKGNASRGLEDISEAIRLAPRGAFLYTQRGDLLRVLGEYEAALDDFERGIKLQPQSAWNYLGRGQVWLAKGELGAALRDFEEAVRCDGKNDRALSARAWLLATAPDEKIRDGKRALADARRAAELTNWTNGIVLDTLAAAYAEVGEFDKAVTWQENALALEPELPEAKARLELYRTKMPFHGLPKQNPPSVTIGIAL
jgi:tetratricopeptide (TPR) repeat protein